MRPCLVSFRFGAHNSPNAHLPQFPSTSLSFWASWSKRLFLSLVTGSSLSEERDMDIER